MYARFLRDVADTGFEASWYAATVPPSPGFPALKGDLDVDVAIVGAGYTGLNAAIELTQKNFSVAVLEARQAGWGCSGRNGGQVIGGMASFDRLRRHLGEQDAQLAWKVGVEGLRILRERIERFDIDCDWKPGYFAAACKSGQMRDLLANRDREIALGYPHELAIIDRAALAGVIGSEAYVGGVLDAGGGHVHPLRLCIGEARAAAALGVRIFEHSPVTRLQSGAHVGVHTPGGVVRARYVIIAGDIYLGDLLPELTRAILPAGSYIIATEPLPGQLASELLPRDCAVSDQNVLLDYFHLSADRRLLFGGRCNHSGRKPRNIAAALRPRMLRVFPQLRGARIDYQWGGTVSISLKRIPQFGRLDGNILYAQGYSGHGLVPAHVAGRLLAEAVAGDAGRFDVFARVKHWKLPGGRRIASALLALGMTYYRLLDLL